jgi:hypothetical protein
MMSRGPRFRDNLGRRYRINKGFETTFWCVLQNFPGRTSRIDCPDRQLSHIEKLEGIFCLNLNKK